MHPLTKVFVVLMTVLSIVLVSMVVPFVANTENYRDQRENALAYAKAAEASAAVAQQQISASQETLTTQIDALKADLAGVYRTNDSLKAALVEAQGKIIASEADAADAKSNFRNLTSANAQYATIQEGHTKELAIRRKENLDQAKTIIELTNANNDFASATAALRRQLKLAQENLVKTQEELAEVNAVLSRISPEAIAAANPNQVSTDIENRGRPSDVVIEGQVSDVKQAGDTTLVQLNIGSNGGVKERMSFVLSRDGQYLGTIVVMTVDEQAAVGRVRTLKNGAAIKSGDKARSGPIN